MHCGFRVSSGLPNGATDHLEPKLPTAWWSSPLPRGIAVKASADGMRVKNLVLRRETSSVKAELRRGSNRSCRIYSTKTTSLPPGQGLDLEPGSPVSVILHTWASARMQDSCSSAVRGRKAGLDNPMPCSHSDNPLQLIMSLILRSSPKACFSASRWSSGIASISLDGVCIAK